MLRVSVSVSIRLRVKLNDKHRIRKLGGITVTSPIIFFLFRNNSPQNWKLLETLENFPFKMDLRISGYIISPALHSFFYLKAKIPKVYLSINFTLKRSWTVLVYVIFSFFFKASLSINFTLKRSWTVLVYSGVHNLESF